MMNAQLGGQAGIAGAAVLEYVSDLITASPLELYSRTDLLVLLQHVRDDLIAPEALVEWQGLPEAL